MHIHPVKRVTLATSSGTCRVTPERQGILLRLRVHHRREAAIYLRAAHRTVGPHFIVIILPGLKALIGVAPVGSRRYQGILSRFGCCPVDLVSRRAADRAPRKLYAPQRRSCGFHRCRFRRDRPGGFHTRIASESGRRPVVTICPYLVVIGLPGRQARVRVRCPRQGFYLRIRAPAGCGAVERIPRPPRHFRPRQLYAVVP